ncbi:MAG: aldose 1-epimerase family protein [Cyanobacteria bacterium P01_F01_bin.42]
MHFTLQNSDLLAMVASGGAELVSLKGRRSNLEYIWQATPKVWGRHAPILFPIVGRLQDDTLRFGAQTYSMRQHGFARDSEFSCVEQAPERISLRLTANETTRSRYPFEFALTVSYELLAQQLKVSYSVENCQDSPIYFSIGAHPGFTCPLLPGSQFDDYGLRWDENEILDRFYLGGGLQDGRTAPLMQQSNHLPLTHELFRDDALIVKSPKSQRISLVHRQKGAVLSLHFPNYPYLGIWTKPDPAAEFICIEPWHGIADSEAVQTDFSQKEGIIALPAGETFRCDYRIEVHPEAIG